MTQTCKNCGNEYEGKYCNNCGQKASTGKLTFRSVLDNWAYGLTNCDTGILFTYKELFTRPGHMLADYISGKRVIYFQPFPTLFITAGLYGILSQILVAQPFIEQTIKPAVDASFLERMGIFLYNWIHTSMSLLALITLPIFAWAARWVFHTRHTYRVTFYQLLSSCILKWIWPLKKRYSYTYSDYLFMSGYRRRTLALAKKHYPYNFTEYLFIFAYIACQRLVIGIFVSIPIMVYTGKSKLTGWGFIIVYLLYFLTTAWDIKQLFNLSVKKAIGKTICFYLAAVLLILLMLFVFCSLLILCIYLIKILYPEKIDLELILHEIF